MTSDRDKCGLSSLLPMSCRGRAEAFARRLHTRLRSLGSQEGNGAADESSWLGVNDKHLTLTQPRHSSDSGFCLDFVALESPGSPEDETEGSELEKLINKDNLKQPHGEDCHCPVTKEKKIPLLNSVKATSNDSDSSDGPFYDTENDLDPTMVTNHCNGISHSASGNSSESTQTDSDSKDSDSQECSYPNEDVYVTTSECTAPPCSSSMSEETSTLSLKDDGSSSSEIDDSSSAEMPQLDDVTETREPEGNRTVAQNGDGTCTSCLSIDKDLTIECPNVKSDVNGLENGSTELAEEPTTNDPVENCVTDDDDAEIEERIPRVRRCSSLKTGKTPPGTPGRKKIVRFADVLGLDLADVRTFLDEIPKVPTSAYEDLRDVDLLDSEPGLNSASLKFHGIKADKVLVAFFEQPGGQPNFLDRVRDNYVCLENAIVEDPLAFAIKGMVRVRNLDFHKSVYIRYSLDSWLSFADVQGVYVENSCDGFSDKFSFLMYAHTLSIGQKLEFAVRFQCKGSQYWDSNNGANYCFQCLRSTNNPPYPPITGVDDNWGASFY